MTQARVDRVAAVLRWLAAAVVAAGGAAHLALLFYIFFSRLTYPFDLEWMEGGMLCHALRLMEGRPLYAAPSAEFISYLYTPLYPLVLAALGKVVGLSYALGRAISVASFLGVLAFGVRAVWRETGNRRGLLWGIGAAGLCAASFQYTGAWYDLVRNDSLYLLLVTAALYLLRYHHGRWRWLVTASVLAGLAFLAKQTASMFIVYSGLALLVLNWRRLPVHVAIVGVVAGGTALLWNQLSDGWFWRYTFEMHQGHDLYWERVWPETELKLVGFFPAVAGAIGLWVVTALLSGVVKRRFPAADRSLLYWLGVALVGVTVSAVGFATQWASSNAYIPGLVFPSLFVAMAGANLAERWRSGGARWLPLGLGLLVAGGVAWQLFGTLYRPGPHLPSERDYARGQALIAQLRKIDGPLLMPYHPFYPYLAGKRPGYPQMGINDVTRAGYPFPQQVLRRVATRFYRAIILDNPPHGRYDFIFGEYKLQRYFRGDEVPQVVTGYQVRPTYMFVPKTADPVPKGGRRVFGFEDGGYDGWDVKGTAFGTEPSGGPIWSQGPVGPFEGAYLVNSFHGGDYARGSMRSPEFVVDRQLLAFRLGGGRRPGEIAVRLLVDGQTVHSETGPGSDIMVQRRVDVSEHLGKRMRIELIDNAMGAWGHLTFDDVILLR